MLKKFQDVEPIIDEILEKKRSKWRLGAIKHLDFDDIKQEIKLHIHDKFDMWDQNRAFENWASIVIRNQIHNKKRNLWRNHEKPCANCYFNDGLGHCKFTPSGNQCGECVDYSEWELKRKDAYEMKNAVSVESESGEIFFSSNIEIDYDRFLESLSQELNKLVRIDVSPVTKITYKIFILTYIKKMSDEEIAKEMDYKTNEKNRSPGYRNLCIHRGYIKQVAKDMLAKEDWDFA